MDKVTVEIMALLRELSLTELTTVRGLVFSVLYPPCRQWCFTHEPGLVAVVIGGIEWGEE